MSFEAERFAIENHFQQKWSEYFSSAVIWGGYKKADGSDGAPPQELAPLRVAFDNVSFRPPKPNLLEPQESVWVRLTILPAGASQITVGSDPILQHNGVISVQIFHPINARANVLPRFADIIARIFDLQALEVVGLSGVVVQCLRSTMARVGPFNDWYQANINTIYIRQGQGDATTSAADRRIAYGILSDPDDEATWIRQGVVTFSTSLSTTVVFPPVTATEDRFWFEPSAPDRFAFGAVYDIAMDPNGLGSYDHQWTPHNPNGDFDRVIYLSDPYDVPGTEYVGVIHHLFEIA